MSANVSTPKYFAVNTLIFPELHGILPFDLYLRLASNKYTKVFNKGVEIEHKRLNNYILKGTEQFFILKQDRRTFLKLSQRTLGDLYAKDQLNKEEALHILTDLAAQTLSEIFNRYNFDHTSFELSTTLVSGYLAVTYKHPEVLPSLLKLAKTKRELYNHSIMTSIFSCLLARQLEPNNKKFHLNAGLAGFLHDIGMCKLSYDVDEHGQSLGGDARLKLIEHPTLGANMVGSVREIPHEVKMAIAQHHENMNGTGYPYKIEGEKISRLGRLVALTEEFSALIGGSKVNPPISPSLAVHALQATDRLDPEMVNGLRKLLKL